MSLLQTVVSSIRKLTTCAEKYKSKTCTENCKTMSKTWLKQFPSLNRGEYLVPEGEKIKMVKLS